jgi:hypothetical protein
MIGVSVRDEEKIEGLSRTDSRKIFIDPRITSFCVLGHGSAVIHEAKPKGAVLVQLARLKVALTNRMLRSDVCNGHAIHLCRNSIDTSRRIRPTVGLRIYDDQPFAYSAVPIQPGFCRLPRKLSGFTPVA